MSHVLLQFVWLINETLNLQQYEYHLSCQHKRTLNLFKKIQVHPKDHKSQLISK